MDIIPPPLIGIGLTDLPKYGSTPGSVAPTGLTKKLLQVIFFRVEKGQIIFFEDISCSKKMQYKLLMSILDAVQSSKSASSALVLRYIL